MVEEEDASRRPIASRSSSGAIAVSTRLSRTFITRTTNLGRCLEKL